LRIESLELEGPRDDEVLVGIVATGTCHTDIDFYDDWDAAAEPVVLVMRVRAWWSGSAVGRSLSCNRSGKRRSSGTVHGLHRYQHGACWFGRPPFMWPFCGYNENPGARRKNVLIDYESLQRLIGAGSYDQLRCSHKGWMEEYLRDGENARKEEWTVSIAVGSRPFVEKVKALLGFRAKGEKS